MVLDPKLLVNALCTFISLDPSLIEKLMCCPREMGPTAFHSSTMKPFLLGGTRRLVQMSSAPDGCPPKAPKLLGSLGFQMLLATVDLG